MKTAKRIPIKDAKALGVKLGYSQVIITAFDKVTGITSVCTWGQNVADCKMAADGGNMVKKALGWPDEMCQDQPARFKKLIKEVHILSDDKLWKIIQDAQWSKDHNDERINDFFMSYGSEIQNQLDQFAHNQQNKLKTKFHDDWLGNPGIQVSDDGWHDLTAEVVGRGKKFYEAITLKKLQQMANDNDYCENFMYSFL